MMKLLNPYVRGSLAGLLLASSAAAADISQVKDVADYVIRHGTTYDLAFLKCYRLEIEPTKLNYQDAESVKTSGVLQPITLETCLLDDKKIALSIILRELDRNNRHYKMTMVQDGNVNLPSKLDGEVDALVRAKIEEAYVGSVSDESSMKNVKLINLDSTGATKAREEAQSLYDRVIPAVHKYITTKK